MESDISPEMETEAQAAFRQAIVARVLFDRPEIDARTAAALQKVGLLQDAEAHKVPNDLSAILREPDHPKRVDLGVGPLLFVTDGPKQRAVVDVKEHLVSPFREIRAAALAFFQDVEQKLSDSLTPRTKSALRQAEQDLAADDHVKWREAGLGLRDALEDDWLCSLEGARQSLRAKFDDGIDTYLTRVIRPTLSSLDSITMEVRGPADESQRLGERLQGIAKEAKDLGEALDLFYRSFGYLPFSSDLSLPGVLKVWEANHGALPDAWDSLWEWANKIDSPLPRYYVCQCFVSQPDRIPEGKHADLWRELLEIVDFRQGEKSTNRWCEPWNALCELARHFCMQLEFQRQGQYGEGITAFSWWLAKRTLGLFGTSPENLKAIRETTIQSEWVLSSHVWQLFHPLVTASSLRCVTLSLAYPWSRAMLCGMGASLPRLRMETMSASDRERLRTIMQGLLVVLPADQQETPTQPVYGFDHPSLEVIGAWLEIERDEPKNAMIRGVLPAVEKLTTTAGFAEEMRGVSDRDPASQMVIMQALKARAYSGNAPVEEIWKILSKEHTRHHFFQSLSLELINLAVDSLLEVAVHQGGKWATHLPHFFAMECEIAKGDSDRRELLFAAVVLSSGCFDSVSAINRLLRGQHRHSLTKEADYWRKRHEEIWALVPPWVQARIRAMLSALPAAAETQPE